jgi:arylsulfatase A-like enzyme
MEASGSLTHGRSVERKPNCLEGGLGIPGLISWPGRISPGRTTDQVAISMDGMPTLLAAAGRIWRKLKMPR